jgi:glycine oxidase
MTAPLPTKRHDVAVVGGGIVGLACAWHAARRGMSVVVLERDRLGGGASDVAAGMLAPVTEADFGEDALLELNLAAADRWPAFAAELAAASGLSSGFRETGALVVAADRDDAEELQRLAELHAALGLPSRWLGPRECRALEPGLSPRVRGAIHAPRDHQTDPVATVRALTAACRSERVDLCEHVEVAALVRSGGSVTGVATATAEVRARAVVVAAGAWSAGLAPNAPPIRPVKGQIAALRAPDPALAPTRIVRTPRCYLLARADGRVVLGATVEERGFDRAITAGGVHELLREAYRLLPEVAELEIVEMTAGVRPGSPDNAPLVGRAGVDGLVLATGHYRNGILLAPHTAGTIAAILAGEPLPPAAEGLAPGRFDQAEAVA